MKGEVSNCKYHTSGHIYFSLKDESGTISCVMFASARKGLAFGMKNGQQVLVLGNISVYERDGTYQLYASRILLDGAGLLYEKFEALKAELEEMGMFDPVYKKPIPPFVKKLGVVTAPTGAAVRDIIQISRRRNPGIQIILYPALVQGEGAAEKVAAAIRGFNALDGNDSVRRPDVIIVARGGGSLEDLWPFNEEVVIRAVYDSEIPLISAVGHETDTMLIDYAADKRAPTPTGAAEFAVPVKDELVSGLNILDNRMRSSIRRCLEEYKSRIEGLGRGIPNLQQILEENVQKLDYRLERLHIAIKNVLIQKKSALALAEIKPVYVKNLIERSDERLQGLAHRLEGVSVESVLRRGFAWVRGNENQTIYNVTEAKKQTGLTIRFADGEISAAMPPQSAVSTPATPRSRSGKSKKTSSEQGTLFEF